MEKKSTLKVNINLNWLDVFILDEFSQYLKGSDLIELSLLSKLVRDRLKATVFKTIWLEDHKLRSDIFYFGLSNTSRALSFNKMEIYKYKKSEQYLESLNTSNYKELVIDPYLQAMKVKFQIYSPFIKVFKFDCVMQPCYYMINLVELTPNLTTLDIKTGFLLFNTFAITLNGLQHLTALFLENLTFVRFDSDIELINEVTLPKSLKNLQISSCGLIATQENKDPYKLLFSGFSVTPVSLPLKPENLPKLERFGYTGKYRNKLFLFDFIKHNPQIRFIKIRFEDLLEGSTKLIRNFKILKYILLDSPDFIYLESGDANFSGLESIQTLEMTLFMDLTTPLFLKLLLSCKNLKTLKIKLDGCFDFFLNIAMPKLVSLKSVYLDGYISFVLESFDFSNFSNIEHLTVVLNYKAILNLQLPTKTKLKTIFIRYDNWKKLDIGPIKNKYQNANGWNCSVNDDSIICYRKNITWSK